MRHTWRRLSYWGLLLLSAAPFTAAWAERKALVIGNAAYAERQLPNPLNDARDMAAKLRALGFRVTPVEDANKREFIDALESFRATLGPDDDAVFYFAGHGAQFEGRNYLIPLAEDIRRDEDLETEAVDLKRVLNALSPVRNGLKLAILDACRNNPYPGSSRASTRGLARVADVPNQTLLWFAASPGEEAEDGKGRNGLFTGQLLKVLDQPGLKAEEVFKQVAREVIAETQGRVREQHPYPEGQTLVDFYFAGTGSVSVANVVPTATPAAVSVPPPAQPKRLQPPVPDFGIEMVDIPGGEFLVGPDEYAPDGRVQVKAFSIGKTEVTQGQWRLIMGSNPPKLHFKNCGDDCPVENVSFEEVQKFVQNLNVKTGHSYRYRLPTAREWLVACLAGETVQYCGANTPGDIAWFRSNSINKTHPVKHKNPNSWGIYDLSGNVMEWTADCRDGACVLRGGGWYNKEEFMRASNLERQAPSFRDSGKGFRLARD